MKPESTETGREPRSDRGISPSACTRRFPLLLSVILALAALSVPVRGLAATSPQDQGPASAAQIKRGRKVFNQICFACHQHNGLGMPHLFPPLAKSDFLKADPDRAVWIVTHGLVGPVTVNGKQFNSAMPSQQQLSDEQVADVLTFVLNSWGNSGGHFTAASVHELRTHKG